MAAFRSRPRRFGRQSGVWRNRARNAASSSSNNFVSSIGLFSAQRLQTPLAAGFERVIPRANILADVAAEEPIANARAQIGGNRVAKLDRQIADAARGIEDVGLRKRIRGTGIEARPARAAMIGLVRRVVIQFDIGQQRRQEEPTASRRD